MITPETHVYTIARSLASISVIQCIFNRVYFCLSVCLSVGPSICHVMNNHHLSLYTVCIYVEFYARDTNLRKKQANKPTNKLATSKQVNKSTNKLSTSKQINKQVNKQKANNHTLNKLAKIVAALIVAFHVSCSVSRQID